MYIPDDRYVWDFWLIPHAGRYHLFHLQAPRGLLDPEMRHGLATVGHAVSEDLINWQYLGTALGPGRPGEWDDRAIWTGSIIEKEGLFYMLYTGTCRAENGKIQRIGLAVSRDLLHWERHPNNPVLEADMQVYESAEESPFGELAWRDPYVIFYQGTFLAAITARRNKGELKKRGCIATAYSDDLVRWRVGPPLDVPGGFAQMEVPQIICYRKRYYLLFSAVADWIEDKAIPKLTGTFYALASHPLGPYSYPKPLLADPEGSFYAAKLIQTFEGTWVALAWVRIIDGKFVGGLSDPISVRFKANGEIEVEK
ncbi:glycosyl hydrolase family 32 [Candidatus Bipolaricaulota bacterium]|nr:glycosyl hydrolase family 32 [Candidatus Bipolaricaulota bacterium]